MQTACARLGSFEHDSDYLLYAYKVVVAFSSGECSTIHSPPALFLFLFCFFFGSGDYLAHTNSTLLCQDQSTVAQRAETTVAKLSLTSYM